MRRPPSPAKIPTATQGIRPRPKDRPDPAPCITCTWLRPHGENGSCLLNPIKFAGVRCLCGVLCVHAFPYSATPTGTQSLPVTSKRRPDASHSWRPLRVLLYLICVTPLPLPRPAHVINLASPQGQHLSHHSPRHTPKVHLQSSTFYPTSSFRHLGLQSLPTLSSSFPYRFPFPLLCRHCISSSASLLPMVSSARIRRTAICASFLCTSHIPLHLGNSRTTAVLYDGLRIHSLQHSHCTFRAQSWQRFPMPPAARPDPTSFTAACTPATCLASHAHFHRASDISHTSLAPASPHSLCTASLGPSPTLNLQNLLAGFKPQVAHSSQGFQAALPDPFSCPSSCSVTPSQSISSFFKCRSSSSGTALPVLLNMASGKARSRNMSARVLTRDRAT